MKKNDILLVIVIALVAFSIMGYLYITEGEGAQIIVTVDGKKYGEYDLSKDQTISIKETNICKVEDGKVSMIDANCPDKLCVHHKPISKDGESIICLPNRVVVSITGGEDGELDAVTN